MDGNNKVLLTAGSFTMILERERLTRRAVEMSALNEQGTICILNAPGRTMAALAFQTLTHGPNWFPDSIGPFIWRAFIFPLFAIPAWYFVGRGIDGILLRARMRLADLILSVVLVLISVLISAGLRFGLSESERADPITVVSIYGFALWSLLFAFPLTGWILQTVRSRSTRNNAIASQPM